MASEVLQVPSQCAFIAGPAALAQCRRQPTKRRHARPTPTRAKPKSSRRATACSISIAPTATAPTPCRASARAICGGCRIRYGDDAIVVFYTTINNGRMDKGMPVWKGVLSEDVMWKIFTFLSSVQTEP